MKIDTLFDIGDTVWHMRNNKAVDSRLKEIKIVIANNGLGVTRIEVTYHVGNGNTFESHELFTTKQELLDSL